MIGRTNINPPRDGEGDHEVVEGECLNHQYCVWSNAPSVTSSQGLRRATSPQAGRIEV